MKILILIVWLLCRGVDVFSKEATGADFLKLIVDGRVSALGGSVVGLSDNLSCLYYQTAALGSLKKDGIFLMYSEAFESEKGYQAINYCKKFKKNAGVGIGLLCYKNDYPITKLDTLWEEIGKGKYQDLAIILGYANELVKDLFYGLGIKYIDRYIDGRDFSRKKRRVLALDFGLLFVSRNLSVGLNLQNIGPKIYFINKEESDNLPHYLNAGICYKLANIKFLFDIKHMLLEHSKIEYSSGIELGLIKEVLVLRGGYAKREGDIEGFSYGIGINLEGPISVGIDFADTPSGQLNRLKQISLDINL